MLQWEHSAILSTFIRLQFVIKIFVLSIFEWLFYTGFTVLITFLCSDCQFVWTRHSICCSQSPSMDKDEDSVTAGYVREAISTKCWPKWFYLSLHLRLYEPCHHKQLQFSGVEMRLPFKASPKLQRLPRINQFWMLYE